MLEYLAKYLVADAMVALLEQPSHGRSGQHPRRIPANATVDFKLSGEYDGSSGR